MVDIFDTMDVVADSKVQAALIQHLNPGEMPRVKLPGVSTTMILRPPQTVSLSGLEGADTIPTSSQPDDHGPEQGLSTDQRDSQQFLRHMFETGEWSDLKVTTGDRVFKVHKAIICPASLWFAARCEQKAAEQPSFGQAVKAAEDGGPEIKIGINGGEVIESVFQWLYGQPVAIFNRYGAQHYRHPGQGTSSTTCQLRPEESLQNLERLGKAAYKLGVVELGKQALDQIVKIVAVCTNSAKAIAYAAQFVYANASNDDREVRGAVLQPVMRYLNDIMSHPQASSAVLGNADLARDALTLAGKFYQPVETVQNLLIEQPLVKSQPPAPAQITTALSASPVNQAYYGSPSIATSGTVPTSSGPPALQPSVKSNSFSFSGLAATPAAGTTSVDQTKVKSVSVLPASSLSGSGSSPIAQSTSGGFSSNAVALATAQTANAVSTVSVNKPVNQAQIGTSSIFGFPQSSAQTKSIFGTPLQDLSKCKGLFGVVPKNANSSAFGVAPPSISFTSPKPVPGSTADATLSHACRKRTGDAMESKVVKKEKTGFEE